MSFIIPYPALFKGLGTEFVEKPYTMGGKKLWQACYVCGRSITFSKAGGKWLSIGAGLIRHKMCEPPPAKL